MNKLYTAPKNKHVVCIFAQNKQTVLEYNDNNRTTMMHILILQHKIIYPHCHHHNHYHFTAHQHPYANRYNHYFQYNINCYQHRQYYTDTYKQHKHKLLNNIYKKKIKTGEPRRHIIDMSASAITAL